MASLAGKRVLIIGGSSGIGLAAAKLALAAGAAVAIAARSPDRLAAANSALGGAAQAHVTDVSDTQSVQDLMAAVGSLDHLVVTGPTPGFGHFLEVDLDAARTAFEAKFWGQYLAARFAAPNLAKDGSITFTTGCYSQRPIVGVSTPAAAQAALEGLARALALDLSPIRVNAVSPGVTDTPLIRGLIPDDQRASFYRTTAASLPVKRIATAEDIAEAILFVMTNRYTSGSTLFVDGGFTLR